MDWLGLKGNGVAKKLWDLIITNLMCPVSGVHSSPANEGRVRRYGIFSVMNHRFSPARVILFDNFDSERERDGFSYWMRELGIKKLYLKHKKTNSLQPYVLITLPNHTPDFNKLLFPQPYDNSANVSRSLRKY